MLKKGASGIIINTDSAVERMLADLGHKRVTHGHIYHGLTATIVNLLPDYFVKPMILGVMQKIHKKELEK